jgi:hypothetical protein
MMLGRIPKGRESDTHSEHVNFKKVGGEPNRFEIVFYFTISWTRISPT